ncbi:hypothetical protein B0H13DRAFT_2066780 [Mycena leptocephala]|nr:hypothetical protein B0H13DRAFT_2066780 [Mycena leptocephala]
MTLIPAPQPAPATVAVRTLRRCWKKVSSSVSLFLLSLCPRADGKTHVTVLRAENKITPPIMPMGKAEGRLDV